MTVILLYSSAALKDAHIFIEYRKSVIFRLGLFLYVMFFYCARALIFDGYFVFYLAYLLFNIFIYTRRTHQIPPFFVHKDNILMVRHNGFTAGCNRKMARPNKFTVVGSWKRNLFVFSLFYEFC